MKWYREVLSVFKRESETWLAYLEGKALNSFPQYKPKPPRIRGAALRLCVFVFGICRNVRILSKPRVKERNVQFLFYIGSLNQLRSITSTIDGLNAAGCKLICLSSSRPSGLKDEKFKINIIRYGLIDVVKTIFVMVLRFRNLRAQLGGFRSNSGSWYLDSFLRSYVYTIYFLGFLRRVKPEFVVVANDHSVSNRCLLAVARFYKIKTVYIQHATVSEIFPALQVDFAFLDGQYSLETYRQCRKNMPYETHEISGPMVFLSGQTKTITKANRNFGKNVGVAVNMLDDFQAANRLIHSLLEYDYEVIVRLHPRQPGADVIRFNRMYFDFSQVKFSDPVFESIDEYLGKISFLVAGNSSIHLEAALAGVVPIYFRLNDDVLFDYYGYVRNRIAIEAKSLDHVSRIIDAESYDSSIDESAVRYYSASFGTRWQGREGLFISDCLVQISRERKPPQPHYKI
jgi:hypothetical protein